MPNANEFSEFLKTGKPPVQHTWEYEQFLKEKEMEKRWSRIMKEANKPIFKKPSSLNYRKIKASKTKRKLFCYTCDISVSNEHIYNECHKGHDVVQTYYRNNFCVTIPYC